MADNTQEIVKIDLNPKQEEFARLYSTQEEFFGNGVQSYIEVYDPDTTKKGWYNNACSAASQLLTNTKVLQRIDQLLELRGLNDQFVDKQLELLVTQNADYKTKISAIKEYNSLKKRTSGSSDGGNTFNTQVNINDNTPRGTAMIESFTEYMKKATMSGGQ